MTAGVIVKIERIRADALGNVDERAWKKTLDTLPDEILESMCLITLALLRTGRNSEVLT